MSNLSGKRIKKYLILDFDSTIVSVEGLEMIAETALNEVEKKDEIIQKISSITNLGMEGKITFKDSLLKRLSLFDIQRKHLDILNDKIISTISKSFIREIEFFRTYSDSIYIVSGGFIEWILPVAEYLNIKSDHVFANEFIFSGNEYKGIKRILYF